MNIIRTKLFFLLYLLLGVCYSALYGQDIHFSQFLNSPLTLNPALTGNFNGDWRFVGNYRDQWRALNLPYRTLSASFDRQIYVKNNQFGVGAYIVNDNSGNSVLKTNKLFISGAYKRVFNNNQISAGLQIGYVMSSIEDLTTPDAYNPATGEFDLQSSILNDKAGYLDINVGITWSKKIRIFEPQIGFAFYHLNRPKYTLINGNDKLPIRNTMHASLKTNISPMFYIKPAAMYYTIRGSKDFILGGEAGFNIQGNRLNIREIFAGAYMRNIVLEKTDAMIFLVGAQYRNLSFHLSYDINVSPLKQFTNNRGAIELSIIFKSISTIIKTFTIPCERI